MLTFKSIPAHVELLLYFFLMGSGEIVSVLIFIQMDGLEEIFFFKHAKNLYISPSCCTMLESVMIKNVLPRVLTSMFGHSNVY